MKLAAIIAGAALFVLFCVALIVRAVKRARAREWQRLDEKRAAEARAEEAAEDAEALRLIDQVCFEPELRADELPYSVTLPAGVSRADPAHDEPLALAPLTIATGNQLMYDCPSCVSKRSAPRDWWADRSHPYRDAERTFLAIERRPEGPTMVVLAPEGARTLRERIQEEPLTAAAATDVALSACAMTIAAAGLDSADLPRPGRFVVAPGSGIDARWVGPANGLCDDCRVRRPEQLGVPTPAFDEGAAVRAITELYFFCATGREHVRYSPNDAREASPIGAPSVERVIYGALLRDTSRYRPATVADLAAALWLAARDHELPLATSLFEGEYDPSSVEVAQAESLQMSAEEFSSRPARVLPPFIEPAPPGRSSRIMPWPGDRQRVVSAGYVPPPGIQAGVGSYIHTVRYGCSIERTPGAIY